jgi:hypothetical protein
VSRTLNSGHRPRMSGGTHHSRGVEVWVAGGKAVGSGTAASWGFETIDTHSTPRLTLNLNPTAFNSL